MDTKVIDGGGLVEAVRDGIDLVLRAATLIYGDVVPPQGDSRESPVPYLGEVPDIRDTWVGGDRPAPQALPGVPFKPRHPTDATISAQFERDMLLREKEIEPRHPTPTAKFIDKAVRESWDGPPSDYPADIDDEREMRL